jgi:hypothetical protein
LCDRLPLALRITGSRLAVRPHWPVAMMVDRLRDEHHRLDEFGSRGTGVRAAFLASYDALAARERRTFRLFGSLDIPAVQQDVVAALVDLPVPEAEASLTELVEASLVEADAANRSRPMSYRMHDLLRLFARERCAVEDDPRDARAARDRALRIWANTAADLLVTPAHALLAVLARSGAASLPSTRRTDDAVEDKEAGLLPRCRGQ